MIGLLIKGLILLGIDQMSVVANGPLVIKKVKCIHKSFVPS